MIIFFEIKRITQFIVAWQLYNWTIHFPCKKISLLQLNKLNWSKRHEERSKKDHGRLLLFAWVSTGGWGINKGACPLKIKKFFWSLQGFSCLLSTYKDLGIWKTDMSVIQMVERVPNNQVPHHISSQLLWSSLAYVISFVPPLEKSCRHPCVFVGRNFDVIRPMKEW